MLNGNSIVLPSMLDLEMRLHQELTRQLATNYSLPAQVSVFEHENRDVYAPDVSLASSLGLTPTKTSFEAIIQTVDVLSGSKPWNSV